MHSILSLTRIFLLSPKTILQQIHGGVSSDVVTYLRDYATLDIPSQEQDDFFSWLDDPNNSDDAAAETHPYYWQILEHYVSIGYTKLAWRMLMKHSRFLTCHGTQLEQGFMDLCILLNCAPLPGGTTWGDEEDEQSDDATNIYPSPFSPTSYKEWMNASTISSSAKLNWSHWSNFAKTCYVRGLRNGLEQVIPELRRTLHLLAGEGLHNDYNTESNDVSWQSLLLYDLLYKNPSILPRDISYKVKSYMNQSSSQNEDTTLLNIMNGDAGQVVLGLYELGGRSGAALPTSMNALVLDLLCMADKISDDGADLLDSLLLSAASSCQSSLPFSSIGLRCACRLLSLIPNTSTRIVYLTEFLSNACPSSDAEAKMLLSFASSSLTDTLDFKEKYQLMLVSRSIAIIRGDFYKSQSRPGGAMDWYLRALSIQHTFISQGCASEPSLADERIISLCHHSELLLSALIDSDQSLLDTWTPYAQETTKPLSENASIISSFDNVLNPCTKFSLDLVKHILTITLQWNKEDKAIVAKSIISVIEPIIKPDGHHLLPPSFILYILQLAYELIHQRELEEFSIQEDLVIAASSYSMLDQPLSLLKHPIPIFLKKEIQTLLSASTLLELHAPSLLSKEVDQKLRMSFYQGLRHAIAYEQYQQSHTSLHKARKIENPPQDFGNDMNRLLHGMDVCVANITIDDLGGGNFLFE